MHCEEIEIRLNELLDNRAPVSEDALVAAHSAECAACRELVATYEIMLQGVSQFEVPELDSNFATKVVQDLQSDLKPFPFWKFAIPLAAVAASLLIFAFPLWNRGPAKGPSNPTVANPAVPDSNQFQYADLPTSIPIQRDGVYAFATTTGRGIAELPPSTMRLVTHWSESPEVYNRIRPVTQPVGITIDVLKKTFPTSTQLDTNGDDGTGFWIRSHESTIA